MYDVNAIKKDFPILTRKVNDKNLVYLDNSATTQKPKQVIDAMVNFYSNSNANVHRGIHTLSEEATELYENARIKTAKFINTAESNEIVFTRNTTEAINLIANTWVMENMHEGDVLLTTDIEHHSNFVPWQQLEQKCGYRRKFLDLDENFIIRLDKLEDKLKTGNVKLIAIGYVSNVLGSIQPVKEIVQLAHKYGAFVLIDAAQAVPHMSVDVQALDCDFLVFSAHKMAGPTGIGVLYGKKTLLEGMKPFLFGGGMIEKVEVNDSQWAVIPDKFEAGTPNIADAVAFAATLEYLNSIGMDKVWEYEKSLTKYTYEKLREIPQLKLYGPNDLSVKAGVFSFTIDKIHAHDVSQILDNHGVAVRSGHHCAQPLHIKLQAAATTRASIYIYNTIEDIDKLVYSILECVRFFNK